MNIIRQTYGTTVVIPHGISPDFHKMPKKQFPIELFSKNKTFNMVYVSIVNVYKHQWNVVEAVSMLRSKGYPVTLKLIGPSHKASLEKLNGVISELDPNSEFVTYTGNLARSEISKIYDVSDLCIFASSCETFGITLLEGMAAGMTIACSNKSSLPELIEDGGLFFDPTNPKSISTALEKLINDDNLRLELSLKARKISNKYSWKRCSEETFNFINETYKNI